MGHSCFYVKVGLMIKSWGLEAQLHTASRSLKKPCHPNCCIQSARRHKALFCLLVGEKGESFSDLNEAEKSKARLVLVYGFLHVEIFC